MSRFLALGVALFALLAFSARPWYHDDRSTIPYGLTALEDQQLAGLVMWVFGGLGYLGAALAVLARDLRGDGRRRHAARRAAPAVHS